MKLCQTTLLLVLLQCHCVLAESLPDPTRPAGVGKVESTNTPSSTSQVQFILTSDTQRLAIINGQTVSVGENYGMAKVLRITENEVVLQYPEGPQTLKLFSFK